MNSRDRDEVWRALRLLRQHAGGELSDDLPGLLPVVEVVAELVFPVLERIEEEEAAGPAPPRFASSGMVVQGRSMRVTRLDEDGKPTGMPMRITGGDSNITLTVGERPTAAEVWAKLKETRRKRGIGS